MDLDSVLKDSILKDSIYPILFIALLKAKI